MGKTHEVTTSGGLSFGGTSKARIVRNLAMTPEANEFLADLAQRTGLSEGDVLRLGACPRIRVRNPQVLVIKQLASFEPN